MKTGILICLGLILTSFPGVTSAQTTRPAQIVTRENRAVRDAVIVEKATKLPVAPKAAAGARPEFTRLQWAKSIARLMQLTDAEFIKTNRREQDAQILRTSLRQNPKAQAALERLLDAFSPELTDLLCPAPCAKRKLAAFLTMPKSL